MQDLALYRLFAGKRLGGALLLALEARDHRGRRNRAAADDPLLRVFRPSIGPSEIVTLRLDAEVLLFSPGIAANELDLPSTVFLPGFHRFSFGRPGWPRDLQLTMPGRRSRFPRRLAGVRTVRAQSRHTPRASSSATLAPPMGALTGLVQGASGRLAGPADPPFTEARSSINRRCGTARTGPR